MKTNPSIESIIGAFAIASALNSYSSAWAQQVPPPKSAADVRGTPVGTVMTPEYVETVGRMAYIWGWPLVNNFNRAAAFAQLPEPGRIGGVLPASPLGYISMLTDYISADERFVTCPNQDTVYGAGFQRLDSKPVIVQVPDFGDRYWTYHIVDADGCVLHHRQAVRHEAGLLSAGGAKLEGEAPSRRDRGLPLADGLVRDL